MRMCEVCGEKPVHKDVEIERENGHSFTLELCAQCALFMLDVLP